jgi:Ca2+-binding RTX toxin-like protein
LWEDLDLVIENWNEGIDTVESQVDFVLGPNVENLRLSGNAVRATGNGLDNILTGNAGNDVLDGGAGADTMIGRAGNDTYVVDAFDLVIENAGEGTDTIQTALTTTLGANIENLTLTGTGAVNGTGNALNNILTGNLAGNTLTGLSGNDWLDGGAGSDTLIGGLGDDTYVLDSTGDTVSENASEGIDTVWSGVSYALGANLENLNLYGYALNATGNALNNTIRGNTFDNVLNGGAGMDTMIGGLGNDTYFVDSTSDVITELANEGNDTVQSAITWTIATTANVENITLTGTSAVNATGNALDNVLNGSLNTKANILTGGLGNDTYILGASDTVVESAGGGIDGVQSLVTHTLAANVENLTLLGAAAINATGNTLANLLVGNSAVNTLSGGSGNDILQGLAGNDILSDSAGANLLDGGAGTDTLTGNTGNELFIGGLGNDTFAPGTGADIVAFNRGDGQDTVNASAGLDNTLSLGGGIGYADLSFTKSSNNLVLNVGANEKLTLANWYSSTANRSVLNLQVIAEAMAEFDASSSDPLLNQKVQQFDFAGLAAAFDAAGQVNNLLDEHLAASDSEAIGGDLAYQYGLNGSLTGIGLAQAQGVLNEPQFGTSAQTLRPIAELQQGTTRLA